MSTRLYVGNLPKEVIEKEQLEALFAETENVTIKLIKDRRSGKCRGFAFATVPTEEEADSFIEKYSGQTFMEVELKIEKALPRTKAKKEDGEEITDSADGEQRKPRKAKGGKTTPSTAGRSFQPDPRWASDLEKLKEMLAAQTTNS